MSTVTVLMPVYNGEKYLREAIDSILSQKYKDFEYLIIDDGSTDSSVEIIKTFDDDRIKLLHNKKRLKLSGALNRGLDEANGEYVARMDADDIALRNRIAEQVQYLDTNPTVGAVGAWVRKFGHGRIEVVRYPLEAEQVKAYSLFDCPMSHPTVMIRKRFLDRYNLRYNGSFYPSEDYEFWTHAIDHFSCVNLDKVLLRYRVHSSSMTEAEWDMMDSKSILINKKELKKLGIECTDEQLRLHRNIGRGRSCRCKSISELHKGEAWLSSLIERNKQKKRFTAMALSEITAGVWYRLCFNAAPLGPKVLSHFIHSPLSVDDSSKTLHIGFILLAIFKHRVIHSKES